MSGSVDNTSVGTSDRILNPNTPLAFFTPKDALAASILTYVVVGCLAIIAWDFLTYLWADYLVIFHRKFNWKTVVFVVARLSPLGFLLSICLFLTSDKVDCDRLHDAWCALFILSRCSTALLFYFRVCAVYRGQRYISIFFAGTWTIIFGASLLTFWGMSSSHIGPTSYCMTEVSWSFVAAVTFAEVFNDTLIYLAIVCKLSGDSWGDRRRSWRRLIHPDHQHLTEVFVQDSLIYYFLAAMMNIIKIILYFSLHTEPSSPIRIVFAFPSTVVINSIALRVFRNMKLGHPGLIPPPIEKDGQSLGAAIFAIADSQPTSEAVASLSTLPSSTNTVLSIESGSCGKNRTGNLWSDKEAPV